jgi:hypothetical protein
MKICGLCCLFLYLFLLPASAIGQTIADFENISLPAAGFLNNAAPAGGFSSGHIQIKNSFDPQFQVWDGWAISRLTDTVTPGFNNQYSAVTGRGTASSAQYAVAYAYSGAVVRLTGPAAGGVAEGFFVTNGTYPYFSMKEGDQFAKKFGGETGNDPDFFKLVVKKWYQGVLHPDTVQFFLADYRFANNALDYIVRDWRYVDTRLLGNADSLQLTLFSSDTGAFGMNTPAYFCVDHFITADQKVSSTVPLKEQMWLSPNPAPGFTVLNGAPESAATVTIYTLNGQLVRHYPAVLPGMRMDTADMGSGCYLVQITTAAHRFMTKLLVP